jgi:SAM-dependent methyltransferase
MQSVSAASLPAVFGGSRQIVPLKQLRPNCFELQCPKCRGRLDTVSYRSLAKANSSFFCSRCSTALIPEQGIWLSLSAERNAYYSQFIAEYEQIRRFEGRGSIDSKFYLNLPFCNLPDCNAWQWAIRARTFGYIEQRILPKLAQNVNRSLAILDLGAGNCWLSHRLARMEHLPISIDLLTNSFDGLGAATHYRQLLPELFPRFKAEVDNLPFSDEQFDCAIFNASFHYSENYERTLAETVRCVRPGGTILIADSPTYSTDAAGQKMRKERHANFLKRFGYRSDALESGEYLTHDQLVSLGAPYELEWTTHHIWYGMKWALRPWLAKVRKQREPSRFLLYSTRVKPR